MKFVSSDKYYIIRHKNHQPVTWNNLIPIFTDRETVEDHLEFENLVSECDDHYITCETFFKLLTIIGLTQSSCDYGYDISDRFEGFLLFGKKKKDINKEKCVYRTENITIDIEAEKL